MQLTHTEYVRITVSFLYKSKLGEILIFRTTINFEVMSIFAFISLKIGYFELSDNYDVTATSYVGCCTFLVYIGRGDP